MSATAPAPSPTGSRHDFGARVARARAAGEIVVQPRMGFADPAAMRAGLAAVAAVPAATTGTITLDSYTRTGDYAALREALAAGAPLNGYPLVTAGPRTTREMIAGLSGAAFQIQVRHGCAAPMDIVRSMTAAGLFATEGGPLSYCLPYGRLPVRDSVENWRHACEALAATRGGHVEPHLETFGGCLLGQLCPPSLLVAVSVLEAMFFAEHGLRSVSLSYAQQIHHGQDLQALAALRTLADEHLDGVDRHVVLYGYMGRYPTTAAGARRLGTRAALLAVRGGADRLIVKTSVEAHRIPAVADNVRALRQAARDVRLAQGFGRPSAPETASGESNPVLQEARALVDATLGLAPDVGTALLLALRRGLLDVPFCLHPDNRGRARSRIDETGRLVWSDVGAMPLRPRRARGPELSSAGLLRALSHLADQCDRADPGADGATPSAPALEPLFCLPS
ncbi:methylaspartate mutase [Streptomyces yokosukanensis]|uniref:methylaspartate mutase n=1 Tax=Streptomyces yokosukanensis TaxID=67386 RepID=UPI00099E4FA3